MPQNKVFEFSKQTNFQALIRFRAGESFTVLNNRLRTSSKFLGNFRISSQTYCPDLFHIQIKSLVLTFLS